MPGKKKVTPPCNSATGSAIPSLLILMRLVTFRPLLLLGVLLISLGGARAEELFIQNSSFENPVTPAATFSGTNNAAPPGWTISDASSGMQNFRYYGVWNPATTNSYTNGAPDGANVGVVFLINSFNLTPGGLQQTLATTVQPFTQYTLTVDVGNFAPEDSPTPTFDFAGFPGYRVELLAGGSVIASDNNTLAPAEGEFLTSTVTFTTGANPGSGSLGIRLLNLNGPGIEVNFDDVRLDATAVPEPSAVVLVAAAGLVVLRRRR